MIAILLCFFLIWQIILLEQLRVRNRRIYDIRGKVLLIIYQKTTEDIYSVNYDRNKLLWRYDAFDEDIGYFQLCCSLWIDPSKYYKNKNYLR